MSNMISPVELNRNYLNVQLPVKTLNAQTVNFNKQAKNGNSF